MTVAGNMQQIKHPLRLVNATKHMCAKQAAY